MATKYTDNGRNKSSGDGPEPENRNGVIKKAEKQYELKSHYEKAPKEPDGEVVTFAPRLLFCHVVFSCVFIQLVLAARTQAKLSGTITQAFGSTA